MKTEWWILLFSYIVVIGALFLIPKDKIRLAIVAFLSQHIISLPLGLFVAELGLLEYPVRLFAAISRTSFTYEYFFLPVVCILFNVWYPNNRSKALQWSYYIGVVSILTGFEIIFEKYTELIKYIHWEWYMTWLSLFLTFYLARCFCLWFFNESRNTSNL